MPKETVRDVAGIYDVRVGWRADDYVQVGLETPAGHSLLTMLYGSNENLARLGKILEDRGWPMPDLQPGDEGDPRIIAGRGLLDLIEGAIGPVDPVNYSYTGIWSTLNRDGCNRLIKTVRRARDSAFGRDE